MRLISDIKELQDAFPRDSDGNPDTGGHRRYHEAAIEAMQAQTEFWKELRLEIAKKGAWGLLILICGLILTGAAAKMGLAVKVGAATLPIVK